MGSTGNRRAHSLFGATTKSSGLDRPERRLRAGHLRSFRRPASIAFSRESRSPNKVMRYMIGVTVVRLHPRKLADGTPPPGLSCDEEGVFLCGSTPLVLRQRDASGSTSYCERNVSEINFALSEAYGTQIDFSDRRYLLKQIAHHLTQGNLSSARIAALHLRVPEINDHAALSRLNKAEALLTAELASIADLEAAYRECSCSRT